jgi:hypothetical protein
MTPVCIIYHAFIDAHTLSAWPRINRTLLLTSTLLCALYTAVAVVLNKDPNVVEILFTWFCQIGCIYHLTDLKEAIKQKQALITWEKADAIDYDIADTEIRHHFLRWLGKSIFLLAGILSLLSPPRVTEILDLVQVVVEVCLLVGILFFDLTAVSDYSSRIWRQTHIVKMREERRRQQDA